MATPFLQKAAQLESGISDLSAYLWRIAPMEERKRTVDEMVKLGLVSAPSPDIYTSQASWERWANPTLLDVISGASTSLLNRSRLGQDISADYTKWAGLFSTLSGQQWTAPSEFQKAYPSLTEAPVAQAGYPGILHEGKPITGAEAETLYKGGTLPFATPPPVTGTLATQVTPPTFPNSITTAEGIVYDKTTGQMLYNPTGKPPQAQTVAQMYPEQYTAAGLPITSDILVPTTPTQLPSTPTGANTAGAMVAGATAYTKTLQDYIKELTPATTPAETQYQDILNKIAGLTGEQAQKGTEQLAKEAELGIPQLKKDLADINALILSKSAEYDSLALTEQNKPVTMQTIIGAQRAILNAKAADIGLLQAKALGLQGQVTVAQDTANRAIDLKYETINSQIAVYKAQADALMPILNKQEKIQLLAQQAMLNDKQIAVNNAKQAEKDLTNYNLDTMSKYPSAGIQLTDSYQTTQSKIIKSAEYKAEMAKAEPVKWSEPYLMGGDWVQKNLKTGEIRTAVNVPVGAGVTEVPSEVITDYARRLDVGEIQLSNIPEKIRSQVLKKSVQAKQPRDFTDEEIRQLIREDKDAGSSYEDISSAINSFPQLKNKDRAKLILDEIFEKKKETTGIVGKIGGAISSFFGRLFGK